MRRFAFVMALFAAPASAGEAWDGVRAALWGDRPMAPADGVATLSAPLRASDDRRVEIGAAIALPAGRTVRAITFVIDENPVPVSAELAMAAPLSAFEASATFRLNGPSPVHLVVEADDGALYLAQAFVKTSGQGACAAPPATNLADAMQALGQMALDEPDALARARGEGRLAALDIRHPSLSGMQMDQVTLLYAPAHFVQRLDVASDAGPLFTLTGSISLAEDPRIAFTRPAAAALSARLTDSEGLVFERRFALGES